MRRTFIKFCGCTTPGDIELAAQAGADAVGFIFAPSPRRIDRKMAAAIANALPPAVTPVAVFANPTRDEIARIDALFENLCVQLSGEESPAFVASLPATPIKTIHVEAADRTGARLPDRGNAYASALLLLDTRTRNGFGGSGRPFVWQIAAEIARARPVMVAGGLTPENVARCVEAVRPFGVDVRSGIESGDVKDPAKMRAFVRAVRDADAG